MRTTFKTTAIAALCALILTSCGGGSSPKSGLKQNDLLGNLPAIHADYALSETSFKEKAEKIASTGDWQKALKAAAKEAEASAKRRAKFDEEAKAEWKKIDGKVVPFTQSEAFRLPPSRTSRCTARRTLTTTPGCASGCLPKTAQPLTRR